MESPFLHSMNFVRSHRGLAIIVIARAHTSFHWGGHFLEYRAFGTFSAFAYRSTIYETFPLLMRPLGF